MLRNHYQNNRMILRAHVNAIDVQKPLTQETAKHIRQLLETVEDRLAWNNQSINKTFFWYISKQRNCQQKHENSGNFRLLKQNTRPTTTSRSFSIPDDWPWKQLLSQRRQLQLQHNPALQLVKTVSLHNHHNAATTSTSQHPQSNASDAMGLAGYISTRSLRISMSLIERSLSE